MTLRPCQAPSLTLTYSIYASNLALLGKRTKTHRVSRRLVAKFDLYSLLYSVGCGHRLVSVPGWLCKEWYWIMTLCCFAPRSHFLSSIATGKTWMLVSSKLLVRKAIHSEMLWCIFIFLWFVFLKLSSDRFPNMKVYLTNTWNSKQIYSMQDAAKPVHHIWNCNLSHQVQLLNQKMKVSKMNIDYLIIPNLLVRIFT